MREGRWKLGHSDSSIALGTATNESSTSATLVGCESVTSRVPAAVHTSSRSVGGKEPTP
jgi:hypothetical protein